MPTSKPMKLYYQGKEKSRGKGSNFGDAINYNIFHELFHCRVKSARPYNADCIGIGSILGKILYDTNRPRTARQNLKMAYYSAILRDRPINILGSGFIEDVRKTYPTLKLFRPVNVIALRGHYTREVMEDILHTKLDAIALGDPGILVSEFIKGETIEKKYRMGIVPHIVDKRSELLSVFRQRDDICILDIESNPLDFLRSMAACETVASSSLHGLITADSLHIPNLWIRMSDGLMGGNFKFFDYYSAYGITPEVTDLREMVSPAITPEFISDRCKISANKIEQIKSALNDVFRAFFSANRAETN